MAEARPDNPSKSWLLRSHFDRRYSSMELERNSFLEHWQEIADYIRPRSVRIKSTLDSGKGNKANQRIVNPAATLASRTLRSGLMAGMTSPARPWFKIGTTDPDMQEHGKFKKWLYDVETKMRDIFAKSNLYQVLPSVYGALGDYGTAAMCALEDDHSTVRFYYFLTGQFMLAVNQYNRCDSLYRRFPMTVRQMVQRFGIDNISPAARSMWDSKQFETEMEVTHCIEPNDSRDKINLANENKPIRSVYYEQGATYEKFLRKSGFDEFPVMAPRWDLWDDSCYGTGCPGMDALGQIKALQLYEKREAQATDKWVNPPLIGDASLKTTRVSTLPGDVSYIEGLSNQQKAGLRPLYQVNPSIKEVGMKIEKIEGIIRRCYFEDMMQMLAQSDNPQMTAREIEERHSEKVLILGPVMERMNDELFDPLILRTYGIMLRKGIIDPPPPEIAGQMKIEYISILAQASKLLGTANIEKVAEFTGGMAKINPAAVDKFDVDEAIDTYAEMHGINPNIIRNDDQVKKLRDIRQKQMQMKQAQDMAKPMKEGAQAVKALGDTPNLQDMLKGMGAQ